VGLLLSLKSVMITILVGLDQLEDSVVKALRVCGNNQALLLDSCCGS
jgi:hypothetical protein